MSLLVSYLTFQLNPAMLFIQGALNKDLESLRCFPTWHSRYCFEIIYATFRNSKV